MLCAMQSIHAIKGGTMLLEVENLGVRFQTNKGVFHAVNDVSFAIERGKTLAIVGESGSGKSVTAMSILRLLDKNGEIEKGNIFFKEKEGDERVDLTKLSIKDMQTVRGNKISMIFQEPMTALNPVLSIKKQLREPFLIHQNLSKKQAESKALSMLEEVQIPNAERVFKGYPHQLSGGMRQRVMIAMALACQPKLLIADEPTTALDVTVQAQILKLMRTLQKERGTAILLITHDLGVVNENADEVAVLYCGQVVECAKKTQIFGNGKYSHPYTEGLLNATPSSKGGKRLETIPGSVPLPWELPKGCKFSPRCKYKTQKCIDYEPPLFEMKNGQKVRCFYADKGERTSERHQDFIVR